MVLYIPVGPCFDVHTLVLTARTAVGIIGATIMPHSLFLGSHLATQDRVAPSSLEPVHMRSDTYSLEHKCSDTNDSTQVVMFSERLRKYLGRTFSFRDYSDARYPANISTHTDRENNSLEFIWAHIYHGMGNMVFSLLGFAVIINSL